MGMDWSMESSIVRITTAEHVVVGSGCFLGKRLIVTCAHVVESALKPQHDRQATPQDAVLLDFPYLAPGHPCSSHVSFWRPVQCEDGGDLAILQLDQDPPPAVQAARFVQVDDLWGHPYRVFGFPQGEEAGVWATGQLLGKQANGWIQIEDVKEAGFSIEPGFSGAPVWDSNLQAIVGIVVASEKRTSVKTAFLIPVNALISLCPTLDVLILPLVFIAASPADKESVSQLSNDLQERGFITWHDQLDGMNAASDRQSAIRQAIRSAQVVLLVATPHTRTSHTVREHLRIVGMYQRRLLVIWMAGNELMETLPLGWGNVSWIDAHHINYGTALQDITMSLSNIEGAIKPGSLSPPKEPLREPRNPYKGLRPFTGSDASDFFGREALTNELLQALGALQASEQKGEVPCRLLAVVGPSGSGKSSAVMAGLLPHLQAGNLSGSSAWIYLPPIVPGLHPLESLTMAIAEKLPNRSLKAIREDLEDDTARGLHLLVSSMVQQHTNVILVIDQFEELFTQTATEEERKHFMDVLLTAVAEPHGPLIVILTLRADFYDRPMNYPELGKLVDAHHCSVLPMDVDDLRMVIEKPATLPDVQLSFEGELVGDLLFEMRHQAGALPLLQFTLDQLFQKRQGHLLTLQAYREMGGIRGALVRHAEAIYTSLPTEQHRMLTRMLFLRLIDPGMAESDVARRRAALTELLLPDPTLNWILQETTATFTAARLLTTNIIAGVPTIEVSHEALIWEWPRLADWLRSNRDDMLLQQTISEDVTEWERRGLPVDRLYRGTQLLEAQAWAMRNRPSVNEAAFLQASNAECERQKAIEREQQIREVNLQYRAARRLRYNIGMAIVTIVILILAVFTSLLYYQLQQSLPVRVTNLHDDGQGSLRDAIKNAAPGNAITFAKYLHGTIKLTSGELNITKNLEISGPSDGSGASPPLTISADYKSRVFSITGNAAVSISNLAIKNGLASSDSGGGIYNSQTSSLTLTNTTVSGNKARSGGGISNNGYLTIADSIISNNTANLDGGGIFNRASVKMSRVINSKILNNRADRDGGGIMNSGVLGLEMITISGNMATTGNGGGIMNAESTGHTFATNCILYDNNATYGGGFANSGNLANILRSTISGNHARSASDILGKFVLTLSNWIEDTLGANFSCSPTNSANFPIPGKAPDVGPLQHNVGTDMTHAINCA